MAKSQWSRFISAGGAVMLVASLVLGLMPNSASAATAYTAQASGKGASISLAGTELLADTLARRTADTDVDGDGVAECVAATDPNGCAKGPKVASLIGLPLLAQILSAGVVAQDAYVNDTGISKACAGLVGPGGLISVDASPQGCIVANPAGPGGVVLDLIKDGLPLNLFRLRLDAVYSECSADSGNGAGVAPSAAGTSHTVNAVLEEVVTVPIVGTQVIVPLLTLPLSSAPNTNLIPPASALGALAGLIQITLNEQTTPAPGRIDITALHLKVLGAAGTPVIDAKLGQVSCGPNTAVVGATTTSTSSTSSSTSSSSTSSSSTSSSTSSSSTSSTSSSSTSSTSSSSTSSTSSSTSSTSSTSTTLDPGSSTTSSSSTSSTSSSSTSSSSTSSTALAGVSSTSSTARRATTQAPLANTGASHARAELSLALGLLGLGFMVTGRGMQLGFASPDRRRRR